MPRGDFLGAQGIQRLGNPHQYNGTSSPRSDAIDFLGVVGVLRDFSKKPNDLRTAYEIVKKRRNNLPKRLILEKSCKMAEGRVKLMDQLLIEFDYETFGIF